MAKFYDWINNGVHAVVTEEVMHRIQEHEEAREEAADRRQPFNVLYPTPIFTFSDALGLRGLVTGTLADKERLLYDHRVWHRFIYVPFSNWGGHFQYGLHEMVGVYKRHGEAAYAELRFLTTIGEAMDSFGLVLAENPSRVKVLDNEPKRHGRVRVLDE